MTPEQDRNFDTSRGRDQQAGSISALIRLWSKDRRSPAVTFDADQIFSAIETEIIPRLVLATEQSRRRTPLPAIAPKEIRQSDRELFLEVLMEGGAKDATAIAVGMLREGVLLQAILVDLLAWSARRLGEFWESDTCSFSDVTIGLCRLHEVLHQISDHEPNNTRQTGLGGLSILLGNAPDDQHVFGTVMVAEIFRRDSWSVYCEPGSNPDTLCRTASESRFDIIGLSVSSDEKCAAVPKLIRALRAASRNPDARIMVGGRAFAENPDLADGTGADMVALDGFSAPQLARKMLANTSHRC